MTARQGRGGAAAACAAAALLGLAACTSPTEVTSETNSPTPPPVVTSPEPTQTPVEQITFGPDSTSIVSRRSDSRGVHLEVRAPKDTHFKIGKKANTAVDCIVEPSGSESDQVVPYRVDCPKASSGARLFSITTYGDFDYTFEKPLS